MKKNLDELFYQRQQLVQEVIDRFAEHGEEYFEALHRFNESFPCSSYIENNLRKVANPIISWKTKQQNGHLQ
jgi:hypothetical protein